MKFKFHFIISSAKTLETTVPTYTVVKLLDHVMSHDQVQAGSGLTVWEVFSTSSHGN